MGKSKKKVNEKWKKKKTVTKNRKRNIAANLQQTGKARKFKKKKLNK